MSLEDLASRQVEKMRDKREASRALMRKHMPEWLEFIDALRALGMAGKLVSLTIYEVSK